MSNPPGITMSKANGRLLIALAALLWSLSGFFAKAPYFDAWPSEIDGWPVRGPLLAFWRTLFASIVLFPLVRRPSWSIKLIPAVLIFAIMNVTFLTAITKTTAANAIWLQNTAPAWIFLFGVIILRERVHPRDWLLLGFAALGVGFILSFELRGESAEGMLWGLFGGLTYAGVVLCLRWMRYEDAAWLVALSHIGTAVLLLPYVVYRDIWPTGGQCLMLSGFGILQLGLPYWLFARGLQGVSGHEASGLVLIEPLLVPVWVYLAWRHEASYESPQWWTLVGGGLILTGMVCRYVGLKREVERAVVS
jgi:drug/metabolite transporter (DMT)-like permease